MTAIASNSIAQSRAIETSQMINILRCAVSTFLGVLAVGPAMSADEPIVLECRGTVYCDSLTEGRKCGTPNFPFDRRVTVLPDQRIVEGFFKEDDIPVNITPEKISWDQTSLSFLIEFDIDRLSGEISSAFMREINGVTFMFTQRGECALASPATPKF